MTAGSRLRVLILVLLLTIPDYAQQRTIGVPVSPLGAGPFVLDTAEMNSMSSCPAATTDGRWSASAAITPVLAFPITPRVKAWNRRWFSGCRPSPSPGWPCIRAIDFPHGRATFS